MIETPLFVPEKCCAYCKRYQPIKILRLMKSRWICDSCRKRKSIPQYGRKKNV